MAAPSAVQASARMPESPRSVAIATAAEVIGRYDGRVLGLRGTNHDVFTAFATPTALVKHLEGFSNPRGITQKHLELSTALTALLELALREQLLGAGPR